METDEDFDQSVAIDDDGAVDTLAPFYDARPPRQAWRTDVDCAPLNRPVYARAPDSIRVLIAMRDEEGWVSIRRDGQLHPLDAVGSWASLSAAVG